MAKLKETPLRRRSSAPSIEEMILDRLESIDGKLSSLANDHVSRVTALETQIHPLFDNGQPGAISKIDSRIAVLEEKGWKQVGAMSAVATIIAIVGDTLLHKLGMK